MRQDNYDQCHFICVSFQFSPYNKWIKGNVTNKKVLKKKQYMSLDIFYPFFDKNIAPQENNMISVDTVDVL